MSVKDPKNFDNKKFNEMFRENRKAKIDLTKESRTSVVDAIPRFTDGTDSLANRGFTVSFQYVPTGDEVYFKAFIRTFNETYTCDWASETVFGRTDPIHMFKNTTRNMTMALVVPAATISEGYENLGKLQRLISFLYPTYDSDGSNALRLQQSPLVRMRFVNLVTNNKFAPETKQFDKIKIDNPPFGTDTAQGLLGIIKNLTISHNLETPDKGAFMLSDGFIIPRGIEINLDFGAIHEVTNGWYASENADSGETEGLYLGNGAYNVDLNGPEEPEVPPASATSERQTQLSEEGAKALPDQAIANAIAQGVVDSSGNINDKRRDRIAKRLERTREGNTFWSAINPFDARPYRNAQEAQSAAGAYYSTTDSARSGDYDAGAVDDFAQQAANESDNLNFFGFIK